jgi:outer membrane immunogenic protein
MIRIKSVLGPVCALLCGGGAQAQELPALLKPIGALPSPANILIPNYMPDMRQVNFTGFYVNPLLGFQTVSFAGRGGRSLKDAGGVTLGAEAGYNWQSGSFVAGPAADISYAFMKGKGRVDAPLGLRTEVDAFGSVRGRAGFSVDRLFFYATGGFAWAHAEVGSRALNLSNQRILTGWTAGAGVEYAWSPVSSLRIEYRRMTLGAGSFRALSQVRDKAGLDMDIVNIGFAYRF